MNLQLTSLLTNHISSYFCFRFINMLCKSSANLFSSTDVQQIQEKKGGSGNVLFPNLRTMKHPHVSVSLHALPFKLHSVHVQHFSFLAQLKHYSLSIFLFILYIICNQKSKTANELAYYKLQIDDECTTLDKSLPGFFSLLNTLAPHFLAASLW